MEPRNPAAKKFVSASEMVLPKGKREARTAAVVKRIPIFKVP